MKRNLLTTWRAAILRWLRRDTSTTRDYVPVRDRETGGAMYASPEFLENVPQALRERYAPMTDEYEDATQLYGTSIELHSWDFSREEWVRNDMEGHEDE